jgi:hypothetical protein
MLGLFQSKTEKQKLNSRYDKLMKEAYELSKFDRKSSDAKYAQADTVSKQLDRLA